MTATTESPNVCAAPSKWQQRQEAFNNFVRGAKVGVRVMGCLIAAHELRKVMHQAMEEVDGTAPQLVDQAEVHAARDEGIHIGLRSGIPIGWLQTSRAYGFPLPESLLTEIRNLTAAGHWYGPRVSVEEAPDKPQRPDAARTWANEGQDGEHNEGQADGPMADE